MELVLLQLRMDSKLKKGLEKLSLLYCAFPSFSLLNKKGMADLNDDRAERATIEYDEEIWNEEKIVEVSFMS